MSVASAATTVSKLDGLFKNVYSQKINDLMPDQVRLQKLFKFQESERIGKLFAQPVVVSGENGFTHAAAAAGAFSLGDPVSSVMQEAQVTAPQLLLRGAMDYETAERSMASNAAFERATGLMVKNMKLAISKRLEALCYYGGSGLGKLESVSNVTTTATMVVTAATWAPLLWIGTVGMVLDVYDSSTKRTATSGMTITAVDIDTRTITATGTEADINNFAAGNDLYYYGAYGAEMKGLEYIFSNTANTLFNISPSTYDVWKANTFACESSNLTFGKVMQAISKAANRGLEEKCNLLVSHNSFSDMLQDIAGMRKYDASYEKNNADLGSRAITFHCQTGEVAIIPTGFVKAGSAFLCPSGIKRIGATDITFTLPGQQNEQYFLPMSGNAGFELRSYTAQQIFAEEPAHCVILTGIVNGS